MRYLLLLFAGVLTAAAQTPCAPVPAYSPCDITFELTAQEAAPHPNPYLTVQIEAEFRSPRFRTFRMPAFWDGGRRFIIRFAPTDPGAWDFRVTSNIARFNDVEGHVSATESKSPGFLRATNVHHWALVDDNNKTPHLWMGDTLLTLPLVDRAVFEKIADTRAAQKFTHLRGVLLAPPGASLNTWLSADQPNVPVLRDLDERILYLNRKGLITDLSLAHGNGQLSKLLPTWQQRERFIRYVVARYAAMDITWQGVEAFDTDLNGRALMKEIGGLIKKLDPYRHPLSTGSTATSSPLANDGWMNYIECHSPDDNMGAIEHQLFPAAFVNTGLGYEDSGAGKAAPDHVSTDAFRRNLWNSAMNGQYPTFGNTGTYGGSGAVDPKYLDSPGAKQMTVWFDFFSRTRHWELEPFFDVDGGRAAALEGVEYIVYVEKPGPVELLVEKHSYDLEWFNPITGESIRDKKGFKAEKYTGEPPDKTHDWVLHLSREGRKEGMLRSYKFESRPILMQEVESVPQKLPFEIAQPSADALSLAKPAAYSVHLTRENRATRRMTYLWTAEAPAGEQGYRVIGTGADGTFHIPANISPAYPADLTIHLYGMNANGKVYSLIKVLSLTQ